MNPKTQTLCAALLASVALSASAQTPTTAPATPSATTAPGAAASARPSAQSSRTGPYVIAAIGRSDYDYDCFLFSCDKARGDGGKVGFGYRSGVFGVEGWWADLGRASTLRPNGSIRVRTLGVNAVWTAQWGPQFEGYLRAGVADVRETRVRDARVVNSTQFQPTFGLAMGFLLAPKASLELAWDLNRGDIEDEGTAFVHTVTLGLRLRF